VKDPWHRAHLALDPAPVNHENGLNQVGWGKLMLANQLAQGSSTTSPARPVHKGGGHQRRLESSWTPRNIGACRFRHLARALPSFAPEPLFMFQRSDIGGRTVGKSMAAQSAAHDVGRTGYGNEQSCSWSPCSPSRVSRPNALFPRILKQVQVGAPPTAFAATPAGARSAWYEAVPLSWFLSSSLDAGPERLWR
jgi:hypothetical protein